VPTDNDEGYTGVFKGADHMIVRLSESDLLFDSSTGHNPSVALKFLRDGVESGNMFGMVNFEGLPTPTWDFFANDFRSHLPQHQSECGNETVAKWAAQSTPWIYAQGSSFMAKWD